MPKLSELGEYQNPAIMHSMPLAVISLCQQQDPDPTCSTIILDRAVCVTPTCWLPHGHIFSCYCTRKNENGQRKNPKYHMSLHLTASSSSLSQASRAVSRTAVFQRFQDPFQAVHSWSYSVAHEGTLYPCQGSTAAKSAFISSSISRSL